VARNHAQERGLATPRGPEDARVRAFFHRQVDPIDRSRISKRFADINQFEVTVLHGAYLLGASCGAVCRCGAVLRTVNFALDRCVFCSGNGAMKHLELLKSVEHVARLGSIRAAAEALAITSTALNRQIIGLEDEMGQPLFERLPRGVRLNTAGEMFLMYARQQISDFERLKVQLADLSGVRRGHVTIASTRAAIPSAAGISDHRQPGPGHHCGVSVHASTGATDRNRATQRMPQPPA